VANPGLNKAERAKLALERGLITQERYDQVISSINGNEQEKSAYDKGQLSKAERLELAKERNLITPERYKELKAEIHGAPVPKQRTEEDIGHGEYMANEAVKTGLQGFDFLNNIPENIASAVSAPVKWILKNYGPEKAQMFLKDMEKMGTDEKGNPYPGEIAGIGKGLGAYKDLPQPQQYSKMVAKNLGAIPSAAISGGRNALNTVPAALSTLGGTLAPALMPHISDSPLIQGSVDFLSSLIGNAAGHRTGNAISGRNQALPLMTAAQNEPLHTERSDILTGRQLDLAKSNRRSARDVSQIQQNQHQSVYDRLLPQQRISGSEVVKEIYDAFENRKTALRTSYDNTVENLIRNYTGPLPNLAEVDSVLSRLINESSQGGLLHGQLQTLRNRIADNSHNLINLNNTKKELGHLLDFGQLENGLKLNDSQKQVLKGVYRPLRRAIEIVPGLAEANQAFAQEKRAIIALQKQGVGKTVNEGLSNPSKVFKKIFEGDAERNKQFRDIMSPELYDVSANTYLGNKLEDIIENSASWNKKNEAGNYFKLRKDLQKNRTKYRSTLPENQRNLVDNIIHDIDISEIGVPRNDFRNSIGREVTVGDELKGLGAKLIGKAVPTLLGAGAGSYHGGTSGLLFGAAAGLGGKALWERGKTSLLHNEMLGRGSPTEQIQEMARNTRDRSLPGALLSTYLSNR
jgi:hypothetical protein